jgi:hypothetical protein
VLCALSRTQQTIPTVKISPAGFFIIFNQDSILLLGLFYFVLYIYYLFVVSTLLKLFVSERIDIIIIIIIILLILETQAQ